MFPLNFYNGFLVLRALRGRSPFLISLERNTVRFRFKISLHTAEISVLNLIKLKLGIGIVIEENLKYCSFLVQNLMILKMLFVLFLVLALRALTNKQKG